jgi:hypothetical protein
LKFYRITGRVRVHPAYLRVREEIRAMEHMEAERMRKELPIACTMTAEEQAAWSDGMGRTIFAGYEEARALPDGYALRYPGDDAWAQTLLAFVIHERACCPFFTFGMIFEPDHGAIWLRLSGGADTKAFVSEMIKRER